MQRLVQITSDNPFFAHLHVSGNTIRLGHAHILFLSGMERDKPNVGATASLLLSKDECQDLDASYVERTFDPMTANSNAPHIHTGTARHTGTYLALKRRQLEDLQAKDGRQRVFIIGWREVAAVNPAYGRHVEQVIARLGALHPVVQTEYENVETEQTGRLFGERRLGLIFNGTASRTYAYVAPGPYVATIDVGGADLLQEKNEHDFTVAAIHRVTFDRAMSTPPLTPPLRGEGRAAPPPTLPLAEEGRAAPLPAPPLAPPQQGEGNGPQPLPSFTTVDYLVLQGANVLDDTPERRRLFTFLDKWSPVRIVTDATGLGRGLASTLLNRFPSRVIPFLFTSASKTELLNQWLALIETGRYRHYQALATGNGTSDVDYARLREQMIRCEHEEKAASIGVAHHTEWGVPPMATWRNPHTLDEELLHDDHLLAVSLVAVLAEADLRPHIATSTPAPRRLPVDDW
jgi:hypothetical protein